jgi:hypothetical protein
VDKGLCKVNYSFVEMAGYDTVVYVKKWDSGGIY